MADFETGSDRVQIFLDGLSHLMSSMRQSVVALAVDQCLPDHGVRIHVG